MRGLFSLKPSGWKVSQALNGVLPRCTRQPTVDGALKYAKWICTELQALSAEFRFILSSHHPRENVFLFPFYRWWNWGFKKPRQLAKVTELGNVKPTSVCCQCRFFISIQHFLLLRMKGVAEEINTLGERHRKPIKKSTTKWCFFRIGHYRWPCSPPTWNRIFFFSSVFHLC